MEFRYDFGQKLDLSRFKKQLLSFLKTERHVTFRIYTTQYQLYLQTAHDNEKTYLMIADINELIRDSDGEIFTSNCISPSTNPKLRSFNIVQKIFHFDNYNGVFFIEDPELVVSEVIGLIKTLHKWKDLKAFL